MEQQRKALIQRVEDRLGMGNGTAGVLRGWHAPGSSTRPGGEVDFRLPQSWAWIERCALHETRVQTAMESAVSTSFSRGREPVCCLFEPPIDKMEPSPGYYQGISSGGAGKTEANTLFTRPVVCKCPGAVKGDWGRRGQRSCAMPIPSSHARDSQAVWRYRGRAHAIAADVYRFPGRIGQVAVGPWYTASSGLDVQGRIEDSGFKVQGDRLAAVSGYTDGARFPPAVDTSRGSDL